MGIRLNEFITEPLTIPLGVVMLDVLLHGVLKWLPSEKDQAVETLGFQASEPSFHERIEVGLFRDSRTTSVSVFSAMKCRNGKKLLSQSTIR